MGLENWNDDPSVPNLLYNNWTPAQQKPFAFKERRLWDLRKTREERSECGVGWAAQIQMAYCLSRRAKEGVGPGGGGYYALKYWFCGPSWSCLIVRCNVAVCHHFVLGPRILLPSLACFRDALTVQSYDSLICRICPRNRDQWVLPSLCFLLYGKLLISTCEKLNTDKSSFFINNLFMVRDY